MNPVILLKYLSISKSTVFVDKHAGCFFGSLVLVPLTFFVTEAPEKIVTNHINFSWIMIVFMTM